MNLDDRMKLYERSVGTRVTPRTPAIIRIDGRAFHTFTRGMDKPFDLGLYMCMQQTAIALCHEIHTARIAYCQSDEISILLTDYNRFGTQQWFDGKVQKMASIASSIATAAFNPCYQGSVMDHVGVAHFDARVFSLPKEEVCNYFVWRQQDAVRNSIQSLGQAHFSHKELQGKSCNEIQEMLFSEKGINWNDCNARQKRGTCVRRGEVVCHTYQGPGWVGDEETPTFTEDRDYIDKLVFVEATE